MAVEVEVDVELLKSEIKKTYASVSERPEQDFIFPTGRPWAEDLGYPSELARVPDSAVESFAGVANPWQLGPLNAGVLGKPDIDTTLGTQSLFRSNNAPTTWAEAKRAFNFGLVRIAGNGALTVSITDINGASLFDLPLTPR